MRSIRTIMVATALALTGCSQVVDVVPTVSEVQKTPIAAALMSYDYKPVSERRIDDELAYTIYVVCESGNLSDCFRDRFELATDTRPVVIVDNTGLIMELVGAREPNFGRNFVLSMPTDDPELDRDFANWPADKQRQLLAIMPAAAKAYGDMHAYNARAKSLVLSIGQVRVDPKVLS